MNNVLLTGAYGNVGMNALNELLTQGFEVTTFDVPKRRYSRSFHKFKKIWGDKIKAIWGDLRTYKDVEKATSNIDAVIHLGAMIPPLSEITPDLAFDVNVNGTKNLLKALKINSPSAQFIYTSSFAVYGVRLESPIISIEDSINPISDYAKQKINCEHLIQLSKLKWTILRLTYVPGLNDLKLYRFMFDVPLESKIEICIAKDVGLALINAINNTKALNHIFNISGGESCRTTYGEYLLKMYKIFGLGSEPFPAEAFSRKGTFSGWIKPEGSQEVLKYQKTSLDDFYNDLKKKYHIVHNIVKAVRKTAKRIIIKKSSYIKENTNFHSISEFLNSIEYNPGYNV